MGPVRHCQVWSVRVVTRSQVSVSKVAYPLLSSAGYSLRAGETRRTHIGSAGKCGRTRYGISNWYMMTVFARCIPDREIWVLILDFVVFSWDRRTLWQCLYLSRSMNRCRRTVRVIDEMCRGRQLPVRNRLTSHPGWVTILLVSSCSEIRDKDLQEVISEGFPGVYPRNDLGH